VDDVVHGWDVARSLGRPYQPEPDLLAATLPVAQAVPDGDLRIQGLVPFAPRIPAAGDAGVLDQILSLLGRSPVWPD
jgi:uncharacterized protein (TIGR03086 family)